MRFRAQPGSPGSHSRSPLQQQSAQAPAFFQKPDQRHAQAGHQSGRQHSQRVSQGRGKGLQRMAQYAMHSLEQTDRLSAPSWAKQQIPECGISIASCRPPEPDAIAPAATANSSALAAWISRSRSRPDWQPPDHLRCQALSSCVSHRAKGVRFDRHRQQAARHGSAAR